MVGMVPHAQLWDDAAPAWHRFPFRTRTRSPARRLRPRSSRSCARWWIASPRSSGKPAHRGSARPPSGSPAGWRRRAAAASVDEERFRDGFAGMMAALAAGGALAGAAALTRRGRRVGALGGALAAALIADDASNGLRPLRRAAAAAKPTWNVVAEAGDRRGRANPGAARPPRRGPHRRDLRPDLPAPADHDLPRGGRADRHRAPGLVAGGRLPGPRLVRRGERAARRRGRRPAWAARSAPRPSSTSTAARSFRARTTT